MGENREGQIVRLQCTFVLAQVTRSRSLRYAHVCITKYFYFYF